MGSGHRQTRPSRHCCRSPQWTTTTRPPSPCNGPRPEGGTRGLAQLERLAAQPLERRARVSARKCALAAHRAFLVDRQRPYRPLRMPKHRTDGGIQGKCAATSKKEVKIRKKTNEMRKKRDFFKGQGQGHVDREGQEFKLRRGRRRRGYSISDEFLRGLMAGHRMARHYTAQHGEV